MEIIVRNFLMSDFENLINFFSQLYTSPDLDIDTSTPERITKSLYLHSILNVPISSFGLDVFTCSIALVKGKKIVGAIVARRFPLGKTWIIGPVGIYKEFRRLQIATKLMNNLITHLRKKKAKYAILSVGKNNLKGRAFFEKFGFNYLGPSFARHSKARNHARKIALVTGYIPKNWQRFNKNLSPNNNIDYSNLRLEKKTKFWYLLGIKL